jgi:hypothetical protein
MRCFLLTCCFTLLAVSCLAQSNVGINTSTPDPNAVLDITSSDKGVLIPRVGLTSVLSNAPLTGVPQNGTLVFNHITNSSVTPGFYYWLSNQWLRMDDAGSAGKDWSVFGNSGTNFLNFIGTLDNKPLRFRVNNTIAGLLDPLGRNTFFGLNSGFAASTGKANTAIGSHALFTNSTVSNLVAVGDSALYSNTLGFENTAVGSKSLFANTTGIHNTAFGSRALFSNIEAYNNTAIGNMAMFNNVQGSSNVAVGHKALFNNIGSITSGIFTNGFYNVAVGNQTLFSNQYGSNNVALGNQSMYFSDSPDENTAIGGLSLHYGPSSGVTAVGYKAMYYADANNLGYSFNTALGHMAMAGVSTVLTDYIGIRNTAIGASALRGNTSGSYNVATGIDALISNTIGDGNVALGSSALRSNQSGGNNIAIGRDALYSNNTSSNIAIGSQALFANTIGASNIAIGTSALTASTSSNSIAIGFRALDVSTAGLNLAIGTDAMGANTLGASNVGVGFGVLSGNTTGNTNAAFGRSAGAANVTGSNLTLLGAFADVGVSNLVNATAIGSNAIVSRSNAMVLGNNVDVGIGTPSPTAGAKLHVVGNSLFSSTTTPFVSPYIRASDAFGTAATPSYTWYSDNNTGMYTPAANMLAFSTLGLERLRIDASGRVGIGTAVPGGQFELSLNEGRKPASSTWTIVSDERLKTVRGSYNKGLKELMQLQPIVYNYKNVGERVFADQVLEKEAVGFSAQEVQKVFPEAVGLDSDGYLNLDMHALLVAYLNAIKEQQNQLDRLESENASLKERLFIIESKLK